MRWLSPMVMLGTQDDADALGFSFVEDPPQAAQQVESGTPVVVPTADAAEELLRLLGAPEEWVRHQSHGDWAMEP